MPRRKFPIPGVWAVLALIAGWTVMYFLLTGAIPKDKREPDPRHPEAERMRPVVEPGGPATPGR